MIEVEFRAVCDTCCCSETMRAPAFGARRIVKADIVERVRSIGWRVGRDHSMTCDYCLDLERKEKRRA